MFDVTIAVSFEHLRKFPVQFFLIHYFRLTLVGTDPSISILTGFVIIIALCKEAGERGERRERRWRGLALHAAALSSALTIASWLSSPLSAEDERHLRDDGILSLNHFMREENGN